jgi:glycosyltransferase involved in cell wall biosynthesis
MEPALEKLMRVCYFGTYRAEYARNQLLVEGLRRAGVEVVECHSQLWQGVEDRVHTASGGWLKPAFWGRVIAAYFRLLLRHARCGAYDVLVVGYPGQFDVFLARLLTWLNHKPLAWDVLNSLYLITLERGIHQRSPLTVDLIRRVERLACRLPDMLFLDTAGFIDWFRQTYGMKTSRFRIVPIGADDRFFFEQELAERPDHDFKVIYYGSYIPNHGVEYIVEAAHLLSADPSIHFEMIGTGPQRQLATSLAEGYPLNNITFIDWLERDELSTHIAHADLVLGVFGMTRQNLLTNNNKIYEGFAMRKAVISARTPALPQTLRDKEHLLLCERGDPRSLADAILNLKADPALRRRLEDNGYRIFCEQFNPTAIGQIYATHLRELVSWR